MLINCEIASHALVSINRALSFGHAQQSKALQTKSKELYHQSRKEPENDCNKEKILAQYAVYVIVEIKDHDKKLRYVVS